LKAVVKIQIELPLGRTHLLSGGCEWQPVKTIQ